MYIHLYGGSILRYFVSIYVHHVNELCSLPCSIYSHICEVTFGFPLYDNKTSVCSNYIYVLRFIMSVFVLVMNPVPFNLVARYTRSKYS